MVYPTVQTVLATEIHEYFVPEEVEGRKAVHLDTITSSSAARK
jgi:hypothetical protein